MADSFSDTPYNGLTDHLSLLGVQSILIHCSHVIAHMSLQHYVSVSTPVVADCLAKPKYVTLKVTFGYCLYYTWYAEVILRTPFWLHK